MSRTAAVVITAYNREAMLREAIASALSQDYEPLRVVVLDDHSTDGTESMVRSLRDERLRYIRNGENLGQIRNWNRALSLVDSDFVALLQDDDGLSPQFVSATVAALDEHPNAAFAYGLAEVIDEEGRVVDRQAPPSLGTGVTDGRAYLRSVVSGENWIMHISGAMWRRRSLPKGFFDASHATHTIDFGLFFRAAARGDFVTLEDHLVQVRSHDQQIGREQLGPMAAYGMVSERMDALAYLVKASDGRDMDSSWVSERLLNLSMQRSHYAQLLEPDLGVSPSIRKSLALDDLNSATSSGDRIILIDDYEWGETVGSRVVERFGKESGIGTPVDSSSAIAELEHLRRGGATHIAIGWPARWWLDFYAGFREHLMSRYQLTLRTSRVVVYDLRSDWKDE